MLRTVLYALGLGLIVSPFLASDASAQVRNCVARVNAQDVVIEAGSVLESGAAPTRRERLLSLPRRSWNNAWGAPVACDSLTTITYLAQELGLDQTDGYCLAQGEGDAGLLLVPGERNFRGRCQRTACERVNMAREDTTAVAGTITGLVTGRDADGEERGGIMGLAHSSGTMLLSGTSGAISSALGTTATGVVTALSAPAVLTAAAVSVVAVGGAVYVCSD